MTRFSVLPIIFLLLTLVPGAYSQEKVAAESARDKAKRAETDPWAEFEDEADSIRRWELGLNFGAYFPNKYSAAFYNGTPGNVNNVNYILSNYYWYQDIKRALGSDDTVLVADYPTDMHYQVAFTGGVFLRYNFNRKNGIFFQANYTLLNAESSVTLEVDPATYLTFPDYRYEPIIGKEGRVLLDLGYQRSFPFKSKLYLFVQAAGTMCYTQMLQSVWVVEGTEYSLVNIYGNQNYVPGAYTQEFDVYQNAFGWGFSVAVGAGIPMTELFGLEPGFSMQYYPTNLEGYPEYRPNFSAYLRILLGMGQSKTQ
jgi:hypothetical protein